MTGWRVGYCVGPPELTRAMLLVLQQFSRGPATFVQDAAACTLSSSQDCVKQMAADYQARRDLVIQKLQGIPRVGRAGSGRRTIRDGRSARTHGWSGESTILLLTMQGVFSSKITALS